jgi:hypothetical protein
MYESAPQLDLRMRDSNESAISRERARSFDAIDR